MILEFYKTKLVERLVIMNFDDRRQLLEIKRKIKIINALVLRFV